MTRPSAPGSTAALHGGRTLARRLFWVSALLIAYGSLYPFHLVVPSSTAAAWSAFISDHKLWTSAGDVVGNVVLCLPLGAFALALPIRSRFRFAQLGAVFACSVAYAFALQVAQIFFPPREAALSDAFWNTVGIAIGMAGGGILRRLVQAPDTRLPRERWVPLALLGAWLLTQLAPFIPSLDWQLIKDAIKPLVFNPHVDPVHLLYTAARVLAVGCLYAALNSRAKRFEVAIGLAVLLIAVLAAKLVIVNQALTRANVLGFGIGYVAWGLLGTARPGRRHAAALLVLFVAYTVEGLVPFQLRATPTTMHLLPFKAMLEGAMEVNAWALVEAVYVFGTILWLAQRIGGSPIGSALALAIWVGAIEVTQMWLEGRTSDITSPLLVLALGYLLHAWQSRSGRATAAPPAERSVPASAAAPAMAARHGHRTGAPRSRPPR